MGYKSQSQDQIERNVKTCRECKIEKHLSEFYFSTSKGYYEPYCIPCVKARRPLEHVRPEWDGVEHRTCSKCGESKPLPEYNFDRRDGRYYKHCKSCHYQLRRRGGQKTDGNLKYKYGITANDFEAMLVAQNGRCMICEGKFGTPKIDPNVDHDPATKMVRGLLCRACNTLLGLYHENVKTLRACGYEKHAAYLEKFK